MPWLAETFGRHGDVVPVEGRAITREHLAQADALLVRSVTRVDEHLLDGTPVRFVGSATIGTDHLATGWLDQAGIAGAAAPGCNADSAAQYTLAMTWLACEHLGRDLEDQRVGLFGRGNVGARVLALLHALGVDAVACDPPLANTGEKGLVDRETVLDRDIISLHVPLTRDGDHPTAGMIGPPEFEAMRPGALLVNTARGGVVNPDGLPALLRRGRLQAAFDVWLGEPGLDPALVHGCVVGTPHVAGYSVEGKARGTAMVYDAFCRWAGIGEPAEAPETGSPGVLPLDPRSDHPVRDAVLAACPVARDHSALLDSLDAPDPAAAFDRLRREYRARHEFSAWRIDNADAQARTLRALGFTVR